MQSPDDLGQPVSKGVIEGEILARGRAALRAHFDRFFFFFFRPLNPYNSFTWVTAYVGQWNASETFTGRDYRFGGQQKPTDTGLRSGVNNDQLTLQTIYKLHTVPTDFVDLKPYEAFIQTHLQTDYMHGRLTPSITAIIGQRGRWRSRWASWPPPFGLSSSSPEYVLTAGFTFPRVLRDRSQLGAGDAAPQLTGERRPATLGGTRPAASRRPA